MTYQALDFPIPEERPELASFLLSEKDKCKQCEYHEERFVGPHRHYFCKAKPVCYGYLGIEALINSCPRPQTLTSLDTCIGLSITRPDLIATYHQPRGLQ